MHSAKALIHPLQCAVFSFCLLSFGALAPAAALRVTSTADSGEGSLRAALAEASGGDTVDCSGLSGTIMLTSGELLVDKGVTILGPGPALLAVNGNAASRLFHITTQLKATISG
ncbi:MAG TPA: hypothetical protein VHH88_01080, partial [Verrucomicrobiae bacterium]|nr:hypothetical protein [Verrucomicrobiae bacterium]